MKKDLISMEDLTLDEILDYLALAKRVEETPEDEKRLALVGKVMMVLFYEPSTRTRLSFESAMSRLGGNAIGFSALESTSVAKGESFIDTVKTVENYADTIVIRHSQEGAARLAAVTTHLPVINAGDGANQHPTQTLLDLYTIQKSLGRLDGLRLAIVGDLKYSRTVHSLIRALMNFQGIRFILVSPDMLRLPDYLKKHEGNDLFAYTETADLEPALRSCDVVYMTRIQRERFPDPLDYQKVKDAYCLSAAMLTTVPRHLRILHPLPRVNEIAPDVDATPYASYFQQVRNGVTVRQAILLKLLEVEL